MRRLTKITVETSKVSVIHRASVRTWCDGCSAQAEMVTAEQAALLASVSLRWVFVQIEAGKLHLVETNDGLLFICLKSLFENERKTLKGDRS